MHIGDLRVEYRKVPFGISEKQPRFSWKLISEEPDTMQVAYRIRVSSNDQSVWDYYEQSDRSVLIPYEGLPLCSETIYQVLVSVIDNHGNKADQQISFETGMLDPTEFQARMITHCFPPEETTCPIFYHHFPVEKTISRARIYITAYGVYEAWLNGIRIGEDHMTPGWTSYRKRLQFQEYDVTDLLRQTNIIEIAVGNGWFKGLLGFNMQANRYGDHTGVFAELHIWYTDGSIDVIASDKSWKVKTGEIRYSEIYMGEIIDTTFDTQENKLSDSVREIQSFDLSILRAQETQPVKIIQRIPAQRKIFTPKGEMVIDFGQNITGVVELHVHGKKGQKITIRHAEMLDRNGNFCTDTLRLAKSTDIFICNGQEQVFLPHFTFHGFRYICVEGLDDLRLDQLFACIMHSDIEQTGSFYSSNEMVNQLQRNISWGQRDNFLDIPTDCPQRNERLGWTGDAQVFCWTAAFNRNTALFFHKWMRDVAADSSLEKGVPQVVPDMIQKYSASAWGDAAVIIPWMIYQIYGDERILKDSWKCMHEWVDYITAQCEKNNLWQNGNHFGDWLAMDREAFGGSAGATDRHFIANAFYLYSMSLVIKTALVLGEEKAAQQYQILYQKVLLSFQKEYYTETGRIVSETQTAAVLSLYFNLAREKDRGRILETLISNIERHRYHLTTGFVGVPYLCHVLSENGRHDIACKLFMNADVPSWLYAVKMGATTVWERWDSILPDGNLHPSEMNSLNHYAYGSIGDWMYRKLGGLSQTEPGYKRFKIEPMLMDGIETIGVEFDSVYGKIESRWTQNEDKIHGYVRVPPNTRAEIVLPRSHEHIAAGSGTHVFDYQVQQQAT